MIRREDKREKQKAFELQFECTECKKLAAYIHFNNEEDAITVHKTLETVKHNNLCVICRSKVMVLE